MSWLATSVSNLGVGEGVVKTVSREDGGFPVDVVQCYLDSRQCSDALVAAPTKRKYYCEIQRCPAIRVVDWGIYLVCMAQSQGNATLRSKCEKEL